MFSGIQVAIAKLYSRTCLLLEMRFQDANLITIIEALFLMMFEYEERATRNKVSSKSGFPVDVLVILVKSLV
jgi:hypothetical protein